MENKSEMINRIAELAEENAKLNAIIDSYQPKIQALKDENERLKEENEKLNKMTGIFSARLCKKYEQTLQEIKEIAGSAMAKQQEYKKDFEQILDFITKAEEV